MALVLVCISHLSRQWHNSQEFNSTVCAYFLQQIPALPMISACELCSQHLFTFIEASITGQAPHDLCSVHSTATVTTSCCNLISSQQDTIIWYPQIKSEVQVMKRWVAYQPRSSNPSTAMTIYSVPCNCGIDYAFLRAALQILAR